MLENFCLGDRHGKRGQRIIKREQGKFGVGKEEEELNSRRKKGIATPSWRRYVAYDCEGCEGGQSFSPNGKGGV